MKKLLLISLVFLSGCTFIYDSRGENQVDNPQYQGATASAIRTGRYIEMKVFHK